MRACWAAVGLFVFGSAALAQGPLVLSKEIRLPEPGTLAFAPSGELLAVATYRTVTLLETNAWEIARVLEGHAGTVSALAFSPDGDYLLTGSWDRTARLWRVPTGQTERVLAEASAWIVAVAVHPVRTWVALGSYDERLRMGFLYWRRLDTAWPPRVKLTHAGWIRALAFSPDGKALASGADDRTVKLWDVETGEEKGQLSGHPGAVRALAFSSDGKRLVTGSWRELWVWDLLQGKRVGTIPAHAGEVRSVAFSPRGDLLASGGADGWVKLWNAVKFELCAAIQVVVPKTTPGPHLQGVFAVAFSPDGRWLAATSSDGKLRIWQVVWP